MLQFTTNIYSIV